MNYQFFIFAWTNNHMNTYNRPTASIAVLPFRNISTSQELNYLALGISEDESIHMIA